MKIYDNIFQKSNIRKNGIISLGFFDSLHLGHKKIIRELIDISKREKLIPYILTFKNHPFKEKDGRKILTLEDKLYSMERYGIKNVILCDFERIYKTDPENFIYLIKNNFNINEYVICSDFSFGFKKTGNISTLEKLGCKVNLIEPIYMYGEKVSTTSIREFILSGDIAKANEYLGKPFYIKGIVKKFKQRGRQLGFPTMNITNEAIIYPSDGVYITETRINKREYESMTYVAQPIIETFLIGYNKFSYNDEIKIDFFQKIRDNRFFENDDLLKLQLSNDLDITKNYFKKKLGE